MKTLKNLLRLAFVLCVFIIFCIYAQPLSGQGVIRGGTLSGCVLSGGALSYGGDTYRIVLLADGQWWMAENLRVTDGNEDQDCTFTRYCYDNTPSNCDTYGGLYTWTDMMCGESSSNSEPSGVQGICPNGWHIPSDAEWHTLEDLYDSGTCSGTRTTWGCDPAGSKLADNAALWTNGNLDSHGDFGTSDLDILPSGYRDGAGDPQGLNDCTVLWSSTEDDVNNAWIRGLNYSYTSVNRDKNAKTYGYCVRCVRD